MTHPYPVGTRIRRISDGANGTVRSPEDAIPGMDVERLYRSQADGRGAYFVTWDAEPEGVAVARGDEVAEA